MTAYRRTAGGGPLFLLAALSGCGLLDSPPERDHAAELAEARALWAAAGVASYEFRLRRTCYCAPIDVGSVDLEVRDGAVVAARHETLGAMEGDELGRLPAIPDLFDLIAQAIAQDPHLFFVAYDGELGYPHQITIDFDPLVADDELAVSILSFQAHSGTG